MNYQDHITIEPGKRGGKPCIRGLRITVYDVLDYLEPISKLIFDKMLYERGLSICPYSIRHIIRMCLPGNYLTASGRESILCCLSPSLAFEVVAESARTWEAGRQPLPGNSWQASFTCYAQAASGTPPRKNLAQARPCTVTFNFGHANEYSSGCGRRAWKNTMS